MALLSHDSSPLACSVQTLQWTGRNWAGSPETVSLSPDALPGSWPAEEDDKHRISQWPMKHCFTDWNHVDKSHVSAWIVTFLYIFMFLHCGRRPISKSIWYCCDCLMITYYTACTVLSTGIKLGLPLLISNISLSTKLNSKLQILYFDGYKKTAKKNKKHDPSCWWNIFSVKMYLFSLVLQMWNKH